MSDFEHGDGRASAAQIVIDQLDRPTLVIPGQELPRPLVANEVPTLASPSGTFGRSESADFEIANPTNTRSVEANLRLYEGKHGYSYLSGKNRDSVIQLDGVEPFCRALREVVGLIASDTPSLILAPARGGLRLLHHLKVLNIYSVPDHVFPFTKGALGIHDRDVKLMFRELISRKPEGHFAIIDWADSGHSARHLHCLFFLVADSLDFRGRLTFYLLHTGNQPDVGALERRMGCVVYCVAVHSPMGEDHPAYMSWSSAQTGEVILQVEDCVVAAHTSSPTLLLDALVTAELDHQIRARSDYIGDTWKVYPELYGRSTADEPQ